MAKFLACFSVDLSRDAGQNRAWRAQAELRHFQASKFILPADDGRSPVSTEPRSQEETPGRVSIHLFAGVISS